MIRYPFNGQLVQAAGLSPAQQTGWYWNASESGSGYFIEMQGSDVFLAAYMYDTNGTARWYAASGTAVTSNSATTFTASLVEFSGGPSLGGVYRSPTGAAIKGSVTLQMVSATDATLTLPNGRQVALSRFTQF